MKDKQKTFLFHGFIVIVLSLLMAVVCSITQNVIIIVTFIGGYISIVISLLIDVLFKMKDLKETNQFFGSIVKDKHLFDFYKDTIDKISSANKYDDPHFKDLLEAKLNDVKTELSDISRGVFEFRAESWRKPWREILSRKDVKYYYSASLVKSKDYWQNRPGKESIHFNKEILNRTKTKRIFIIWDEVWDNQQIKDWIIDQKNSGIEVLVARRNELPVEEDVIHDFGIYGDVAVGYQILDENCNTVRFNFYFDKEYHKKTIERFDKLGLYATEQSTDEYFSSQYVGVGN